MALVWIKASVLHLRQYAISVWKYVRYEMEIEERIEHSLQTYIILIIFSSLKCVRLGSLLPRETSKIY